MGWLHVWWRNWVDASSCPHGMGITGITTRIVRRPERVEWYSFQVAQIREVPTAPIKMHGSAQRR